MDSAIIALRLREKIGQFSGILSKDLPKVTQISFRHRGCE